MSEEKLLAELDLIEAQAPNGEAYHITEGLPEDMGIPLSESYTMYQVPEQPHVFTADSFTIENDQDTNNPPLQIEGARVLIMHGQHSGDNWTPKNPDLRDKGLTIPDVVADYEEQSGQRIDAIFVCRESKGMVLEDDPSEQYPYIHAKFGLVKGRVEKIDGKVKVVMGLGDKLTSEVDFKAWQERTS